MQLFLNFLDNPVPENNIWEQLDDRQKTAVIEVVTRILVKAVKEDKHGRDRISSSTSDGSTDNE